MNLKLKPMPDEPVKPKVQCVATTVRGSQCTRNSESGSEYCLIHFRKSESERKRRQQEAIAQGKTPKVKNTTVVEGRRFFYKQDVYDALEEFQKDDRLLWMDEELSYLKTLPNRIEDAEGPSEIEKVELLMKLLERTTKVIERRGKYMNEMKYSVGFDTLKLMFAEMYSILKEELEDEEILRKIGIRISKLQILNSPAQLFRNR